MIYINPIVIFLNFRNLFTIEPNLFEIQSGQSQELTIRSVVKTPKIVSEEYFCHALIGKSPVIRTIFNFTLQAEFVEPQFSFSKHKMDFDFLGDQSGGKLEGSCFVIITSTAIIF